MATFFIDYLWRHTLWWHFNCCVSLVVLHDQSKTSQFVDKVCGVLVDISAAASLGSHTTYQQKPIIVRVRPNVVLPLLADLTCRSLSTVLQSASLKSLLHSLPKQQQEGVVTPAVIPVSSTSELSLDKLTPFLKELKPGKPTEGVWIWCITMCVVGR